MALLDGKTGDSVGEGFPVRFNAETWYVDSFSPGAGVVWLRPMELRTQGAPIKEVKPGAVGLRFGNPNPKLKRGDLTEEAFVKLLAKQAVFVGLIDATTLHIAEPVEAFEGESIRVRLLDGRNAVIAVSIVNGGEGK